MALSSHHAVHKYIGNIFWVQLWKQRPFDAVSEEGNGKNIYYKYVTLSCLAAGWYFLLAIAKVEAPDVDCRFSQYSWHGNNECFWNLNERNGDVQEIPFNYTAQRFVLSVVSGFFFSAPSYRISLSLMVFCGCMSFRAIHFLFLAFCKYELKWKRFSKRKAYGFVTLRPSIQWKTFSRTGSNGSWTKEPVQFVLCIWNKLKLTRTKWKSTTYGHSTERRTGEMEKLRNIFLRFGGK